MRLKPAFIAAPTLFLFVTALPGARTSAAQNGGADAPTPAIRVAPPAPVFDQAERLRELAARRQRVAEKTGPKSVLVLFAGEPRVYTGDVSYKFRTENNLYYLTHLRQRRATLVLMPGNPALREILFIPRRNPAAETWTGHMYSAEEARALSGVGEIWEAREFEPFMTAVRTRRPYRPKPENVLLSSLPSVEAAGGQGAPASSSGSMRALPPNYAAGFDALFGAMAQNEATLYLLLPPGGDEDNREYVQEQALAARWAKSATGLNVRSVMPVFDELRLRKSDTELRLIQHAVDITAEALGRAMAAAGAAKWEYEVEAEVDYTYKRRNADNWGYPSIVGCGANATTLHYEESQGPCRPGDLLLMDVGAEYGHYSADVTRTFPVSGRFTPAQAEIYNAVLAAQEAALKEARPGSTVAQINQAATESIKDALLRLGLITDRDSAQYRLWFMHGTSHWLGMNVHDVGAYSAKFEPGMVFTVEPGIYVRPDALDHLPKTPENEKFIAAVRPAFEKYRGIGVRIEDDVVITPEGHRNMTAALPRTLADVESFIARARRESRQ